MLKKTLALAGALVATASIIPAAQAGDSQQLTAVVEVPHACSIDGNGHLDLTSRVNPGANNVRGAQAGALTLTQNGTTEWTLSELRVDRKPQESVLNWGTAIAVDFRNTGSAPMNLDPQGADRLVANLNDSGNRSYVLYGSHSGPATLAANIDEDLRSYNPLTQSSVQSPLIGGGRYHVSTVLRCTALRR